MAGRRARWEKRELLKDEEVVSKSPVYRWDRWDRWDHLVPSKLLVPAPPTGEHVQAQKGT